MLQIVQALHIYIPGIAPQANPAGSAIGRLVGKCFLGHDHLSLLALQTIKRQMRCVTYLREVKKGLAIQGVMVRRIDSCVIVVAKVVTP